MKPEPAEVLAAAVALAQEAGLLLRSFFQSESLEVSLKSDRSVVTPADLAADCLISERLAAQFPDDLLLSEELQPALLPGSDDADKAVWIVDPLDGTTNFSLGLHYWGVLLTRLVNGWPRTAVLYFPVLDEMYTASQGQGAFLNGKRLEIQPGNSGPPQPFFACCSRTFRKYQVSIPYKARILGSAAYSMCAVARGMAILSFEATPKIWDIAGGWLLVQEAGGVVETLDGSQPFPLQNGAEYLRRDYPTVSAANPELATQARQKIVSRITS